MATIHTDEKLHDYQLECILLYQCIEHPQNLEFLDKVFPSLFFTKEGVGHHHVNILKSIKGVIAENKKLGIPVEGCLNRYTVKEYFAKTFGEAPGKVVSIIDTLYVSSIEDTARQLHPTRFVIPKLKELLFQRIAIERVENIIDLTLLNRTKSGKPGSITHEVNKLLIAETKLKKDFTDRARRLAHSTADRMNSNSDILVTPFNFLNKRIAGLTRPGISGLIAKPKHQKSTFTDHIISGVVKNHKGMKGLMISLEDSAEQRVMRLIANYLDIAQEDMRFKKVKVSRDDVDKLLTGTLHGNLTILDKRDVNTPEECATAINDLKPDFCIIDYIQKFQIPEMVQGLIRAITTIEGALIRNNTHGMLLSQVTDKKMYGREDQAPTASDAQWTSALYQSATELFSLYWQYQHTQNVVQKHIIEFNILACRFADAIGDFQIMINPDKARFMREAKVPEPDGHY